MTFPSNIDDWNPAFRSISFFWDFPAFQVGAWAWTAPPTEPCCWICWYSTIGQKDWSLLGICIFTINMCFYTTVLLHRFLDFAVDGCLSRRCHEPMFQHRSPQPGISIMLAPGGPTPDYGGDSVQQVIQTAAWCRLERTPGPMSREIMKCLSNPVQVQFWYMVTWPICVYNYMC